MGRNEGSSTPLMHHVAAGAGSPPIVLVHGFGCSHTDWRTQIQHFSPRHLTIAVDLPGHGATPAGADLPTIESCSEGVAELLRARALPPCVLVGHSMGCRVVLEAALGAPERVAGIVLVDGSRFGAGAAQAFRARFAAGEHAALIRELFGQMFTARSDPATAAAAIQRALDLSQAVGQALLLDLVRYDVEQLSSALERTRKPLMALQTTFVNEQRQRASMRVGQTTAYLDFVRAKVPGARIEVMADVGHFPQLDATAQTNRVLASFVAALG